MTVRLPQSLKAQLDGLAVDADLSLNTWIVQTLRRATTAGAATPHTPTIPSARRGTGWA